MLPGLQNGLLEIFKTEPTMPIDHQVGPQITKVLAEALNVVPLQNV